MARGPEGKQSLRTRHVDLAAKLLSPGGASLVREMPKVSILTSTSTKDRGKIEVRRGLFTYKVTVTPGKQR